LENASNEKVIECPVNSKCIELIHKANETEAKGFCMCIKELALNQNFTSSDNYCIERNTTHSTTVAPTTIATTSTTQKSIPKTPPPVKPTAAVPTSAPTVAPKVTSTTEKPSSNSEEKKEPIPEPRKGFFGMILVPVMIVLAFIGAVFAVRKYDLIERAHSYIRNRGGAQQHQTRYDGLENDFDDDPLLI
jgi:hypothetical protein